MDDWQDERFWVGVHNNFLDIAVLERCKIFADQNGKHFWKKLVADHQEFLDALMDYLRLTEDMFDDYIKSIKKYRDKFVAHLDEENRMNIPNMAAAIKSCQFLYQYFERKPASSSNAMACPSPKSPVMRASASDEW